MALTAGAIALAASGGYLAGAWHTSPSLPPVVDRAGTVAVAHLDVEALRLVVREEVARGSEGGRSCPPVSPPSAPAEVHTGAAASADRGAPTATAHAHDVLDHALDAGTWSQKD